MHTENNVPVEKISVAPKIRVGTDEFYDLLINSDVFVDKSLLIKEVLEDSGKIILITRPRRWGKSINMDMVRRFLEIEVDAQGNPLPVAAQENIKLFTGGEIDLKLATGRKKLLHKLKIADHTAIMSEYLGQFPVLSITFKNLEGESYKEIEEGLKTELYNLFEAHRYLMHSTQLEPDEKEAFSIYLSPDITTKHIKNSFSLLTKKPEHTTCM